MSDNTPQAPAVDLTPVLDAIGGLATQVKAFDARLGDLENKPTNDPGAVKSAPAVIMDTDHWKYDGISVGELALVIDTVNSAHANGHARAGISDAAIKALAMRLESKDERGDDPGMFSAFKLMRRATNGMKANELGRTTLATGGQEWVGEAYGTELWRKIRVGTPIVERQMRYAVPQPPGAETMYFPLESTDPVWYLVPQAADLTADPGGIVSNTVQSSRLGTARQSRQMAKYGARMLWTGEITEDTVVNYASELSRQMVESGREMLESALIDSDTETGATANINTIAGTPGGREYWLGINGYRKLALVTNTANSRDAGTLTEEDFLETVKLMGIGGVNAWDMDSTAFILDAFTYWKALQLAKVNTRDVNSQATIENGVLTRIYGYDVLRSRNFHRPSVGAGYELRANSAGKIDQGTAANNTKGAFLSVRFDQWRPGYRRQMTMETTRIPAADAYEIVALFRFGMIYRDIEAAAISYNVTV